IPVIVETTKAMGVESELNGHKTMVLGTSGMTVMDQATGYLTLANGGFTGSRHGIAQLVTHSGEVVYDFSRDAPKPRRTVSEKAMAAMNSVMVRLLELGAGRRAALPGIRSAGKTGTAQAYRDAWYVGYTGNYAAAVWLGNDDYTSTRNMTGGSLPAMTWQRMMEFAHQNIDLKSIPGVEAPAAVAAAPPVDGESLMAARPRMLSSASSEALARIADRFRSAARIDTPPEPANLSALRDAE